MASPSKEENVLQLILENSPLKQWHFEEVVQEAKVTKAVANKWLKKYVQERLLERKKEKGKFPYFTVGNNNPVYYSLKRVYSLERLHKSGLIPNLLSIKTAKTVILFGSFARGDWYKDSDIDLFIFGNLTDFDKKLYELRLNKNIELHVFRNKKEIQEVKTGLIKNVINGYVIKGGLQDFAEIRS
ncbi:MAG TPA: nucleotidyltransferase domain-containing protein [Candidatus Nanoarchaeia archaeon]|nr:nucleotidyltransferase domain-containing protein [Candidatus Nanoarchaeia archaeon]